MPLRYITSLHHPFVKRLVKLRESKKFRSQQQQVVIVGKTVVCEMAQKMPLLSWMAHEPLDLPAQEMFLASPPVLKKIIGMDTEDLVVATVALPLNAHLENSRFIIVLDRLLDPGNVGTLIRSALALGIDGVFLISETVDPFHDKVLRAARAASLLIPICRGNDHDFLQFAHRQNLHLYIADVIGTPLRDTHFRKPLGLILGHETEGVSHLLKASGQTVAIPMKGGVESLNVASAGGDFYV